MSILLRFISFNFEESLEEFSSLFSKSSWNFRIYGNLLPNLNSLEFASSTLVLLKTIISTEHELR